jgi:hypothetical protein
VCVVGKKEHEVTRATKAGGKNHLGRVKSVASFVNVYVLKYFSAAIT